jgi:hypothetical protein
LTTFKFKHIQIDEREVTNDDVFRLVFSAYLRPIFVVCADMYNSSHEKIQSFRTHPPPACLSNVAENAKKAYSNPSSLFFIILMSLMNEVSVSFNYYLFLRKNVHSLASHNITK